MKKPHRSKKNQDKMMNYIFGGVLVVAVVLIIALVVAQQLGGDSEYVITADGHVHAADGSHLGTYEEMFGEDYVVTEDGHVHAADGTHLGTYDETTEEEEAHDHAEDEAE